LIHNGAAPLAPRPSKPFGDALNEKSLTASSRLLWPPEFYEKPTRGGDALSHDDGLRLYCG
jgi:hypothetical protein